MRGAPTLPPGSPRPARTPLLPGVAARSRRDCMGDVWLAGAGTVAHSPDDLAVPAAGAAARPHRVTADRRRLGAAATHRLCRVALCAGRHGPPILRPGRRAHAEPD